MEKFGEGHAAAMLRLGLDETRSLLYPDSNIAQPVEYGIYGTLTPGEVADSRRDTGHELEQEHGSILGERMRQSAGRDDPGREPREPPMDRD
jgi:hypothetical protein